MLYVNDSSGKGFIPAQDTDILQEARAAAERKIVKGLDMGSLEAVKEALPGLLAGKDHEVFCCAFINQRAKLIAFEEMSRGTATETPVFIPQVIKRALELNASHLLLVHNHPVGDPTPSRADVQTTLNMEKAADIFNIIVLDHLVVGGGKIVSIEEDGRIKKLRQEGDPMRALIEGLANRLGKGKVHDAG